MRRNPVNGKHKRHVQPLLLTLVIASGIGLPGAVRAASLPSGQTNVQLSNCGVDDTLVPTCSGQALFGAWINHDGNNTGPAGWEKRMLDGQQRYGRDIPLRHNYHAPRKGKHNLPFDPAMPDGTAERRFAQAGGIVLANWKPDLDWSKATGSDQGVDARIRTTARNIKAVGPHKVMLVLHHEPENDVKLPAGTGPCPSYRGTVRSNTPANYRAMWANVQKIFRAEGATNVVWVMNYMGFARWDCLVKDLWPENPHTGTRVDWIAFDLYSHGTSWNETIGRFYNWLGANQDPSHPFGSKPYMLGEFGAGTTDQAFVYGWYDQAKQALDAGTFPNLRAYVVFDACREVDLRTNHARGAGCSGALDPTEQEHFNRFVQHPLLCRALCSQGRVSPTGAADPESGSGGQHELSADPV